MENRGQVKLGQAQAVVLSLEFGLPLEQVAQAIGAPVGRACQLGIRFACAVSVTDGVLDTLVLPHVDGQCMPLFPDGVAQRHADDRIVMVLDGAGWHQSGVLSLLRRVSGGSGQDALPV
jgi:hypothetical protein